MQQDMAAAKLFLDGCKELAVDNARSGPKFSQANACSKYKSGVEAMTSRISTACLGKVKPDIYKVYREIKLNTRFQSGQQLSCILSKVALKRAVPSKDWTEDERVSFQKEMLLIIAKAGANYAGGLPSLERQREVVVNLVDFILELVAIGGN